MTSLTPEMWCEPSRPTAIERGPTIRAVSPVCCAVIDSMKHEVIYTIKLTGELVRPMGVVAAPDGKHIFVTTGRGKNVVIIETATNKPLASIEVGDRPWGIAVSQDGSTVFTANGPSNDVSIVDVASRTVKGKVKVGDRPWGVVFVP